MDYMETRRTVCEYAKKMARAGWVAGSAGNLSLRVASDKTMCAITPTSVEYEIMVPENVVVIDEEGDAVIEVENAPSFEWPMHMAVYQARPDVQAVIHTHALYSTILSVLRVSLPPIVEEMVPYLGGEVAVSDYGPSGSHELAQAVVRALSDKAAALIANHGNVCVAKSIEKAYSAAALLERAAMVYIESLKIASIGKGAVHTLPEDVLETERGMYEALTGIGDE